VISDPVRIVIPAIEVDAKIIPVGLLENGDMQVPSFGLAGWYELGPAPGAGGPAVIVAHVDSKKGPDVFYRLRQLEPGDEFVVYGSEGDSASFVVDSREQPLKNELPTDRIWNDTWEPVIRLITCGGDFDRDWGHYLSNVIVYGHLVK
jgi:sortase (surface protein transpeptidase)